MRGEIAGDATGAGPIDERVELIVQMTTSHCQAMGRDGAAAIAIADVECVLQDPLDARREMVLAVIADQRATPPKQMGQTRLMNRAIEPAIGRPAIAHERAGEVGAEDRGGLLESATRQDRIDRRVRRGEGPEPVQATAHFPSGFIGADDLALADLGAQPVIGGTRAGGGAVQRVHEPAGRDVEPKAIAKQGADFSDRQSQMRVQDGCERHGLRSEVRRRRAQGRRRLQGMPRLHAAATGRTATNLDRERADDRAHDGEIFLILPRGARAAQASATMRAGVGQSCVVALVDTGRDHAMGFAAIGAARPPARASRGTRRGPTRERRGLPIHLAPGVVELVFESIDLLAEGIPLLPVPVPIAIGPLVLAPQPLDLALFSLELRQQLVTRRGAPARIHAPVMPRLSTKYKKECVNTARRRPPLRSVTR